MPARVDALLAVWASSSKDFFYCFAVPLPRVGKGPSLRGGRGPWARTGECGLEAPSPVFSFVYGNKRTALQLLYCGAVRVIRNGFAQAMHGSILSSSCCMSIFWLRMSMSFWRSMK